MGRDEKETKDGGREGRLTVPCNEERGSSGGQKKDFNNDDDQGAPKCTQSCQKDELQFLCVRLAGQIEIAI